MKGWKNTKVHKMLFVLISVGQVLNELFNRPLSFNTKKQIEKCEYIVDVDEAIFGN